LQKRFDEHVVFDIVPYDYLSYVSYAENVARRLEQMNELPVPDRRCRIGPEVLLVRRGVIGTLGIWKGEGGGRRVGSKRVSLQATWD
jgi:hypothetical protein